MPSFLARAADRPIGSRINLGFGVVLLLLCGIAVFNGIGLRGLSGTVSEVESAAGASDALSDFANGVVDAELQASPYLRSPGGAELVAARAAYKVQRERFTRVEALIGDEAAALKRDIAALDASFDAVVGDTRQREAALASLNAATARLINVANTLTTQVAEAGTRRVMWRSDSSRPCSPWPPRFVATLSGPTEARPTSWPPSRSASGGAWPS